MRGLPLRTVVAKREVEMSIFEFSSFGADRRSGDPSRGSLSTNHDNTTYFVILVHLVIAIIEYGLWQCLAPDLGPAVRQIKGK